MDSNQSTTAIENAIASLKPDDLRQLEYRIEEVDTSGISHKIVHIHVPKAGEGKPDYERRIVLFASDFIKDKVYNRYTSSALLEIRHYIDNVESYSGLEGQLFEMLAHTRLANGDTFSVRKLQPGCEVTTLTFSKLEVKTFKTLDDLSQYKGDKNVYLRPKPRNFTSLDSIILLSPPSAIGVQFTVSSSHPVKKSGLMDVMKRLKCNNLQLIFVVPERVFKDSPAQNYTGKRNEVLANQTLENVEQWVLLMKLCEQ